MNPIIPDAELRSLVAVAQQTLSGRCRLTPGAAVALQALVTVAVAERSPGWVPPVEPDTSGVM